MTGIIAELNPLHTGHLRLINEAKKYGTVVAVISGNFVQRGDIAIADKRVRAKAALMCGVDLVLELPVSYAMSTAQNFALGGVACLKAVGCDRLIFGSESGETENLKKAVQILKSDKFSEILNTKLKSGITFAAAREAAARELGLEKDILSGANNNLAIEYMIASENIGADFQFTTIKREGAAHDAEKPLGGYCSATLLRDKLKCGDYEFCKDYLPENIFSLFNKENIADIGRIENAILAVLRTRSIEEFKNLPDISEGLHNKLFSAIRVASSLEELYNTVKVKRYTLARIRRLVLSAFLGLDNSLFMKMPPYVRVLGFNEKGRALLGNGDLSIPVITKVSEIEKLSLDAKGLFEAECRATDLYSLAFEGVKPCGSEYTAKIIKTEC